MLRKIKKKKTPLAIKNAWSKKRPLDEQKKKKEARKVLNNHN